MTRSLLELLTAEAGTDGGPVDTSDHPFADLPGSDVAFVLELGWSTIPPTVTARLQPPSSVGDDLDADASDVLHAVLAGADAAPVPDLDAGIDVAELGLDTAWGSGTDDHVSPHDDTPQDDHDVDDLDAEDHDPSPGLDLPDPFGTPPADHQPLIPETDDDGADEPDDHWSDDLD